jgi:hypothetical protein
LIGLRLIEGIQYFPYVLDCPVKPDNDIGKFFGQGIQISFRIEITGNLDEAEDEAEASHINWLKTLQSDKGLYITEVVYFDSEIELYPLLLNILDGFKR